jgi:hypothetical protein
MFVCVLELCKSEAKRGTVLARLDAGIVGSNPTQSMDVFMYVYVYSMFMLSYAVRGLVMS